MKNNIQIFNSCSLNPALLAFVSALLIIMIEDKNSIEDVLAKRRNVISCGLPLSTTLSNQPEFSTLRNYPGIHIQSNHRTGYGDKGDKNSCPHQLNQSTLWISSDRKYKSYSCGRQYHA